MATYDFRCETHGVFEVVRKMSEVTPTVPCDVCGAPAVRVYAPVPDVWNCDGSYKSDYRGVRGNHDAATALNKAWSKHWNEEPPPPADHVPKNGSEKY